MNNPQNKPMEPDWQWLFDQAQGREEISVTPEMLAVKLPGRSQSYYEAYSHMLNAVADYVTHPDTPAYCAFFWANIVSKEMGGEG